MLDLFTDIAASLSAGKVARFMAPSIRRCPGTPNCATNVTALIAQGDVQSWIDPVENEGTATERAVEWKWTLRMRSEQDATTSLLREESVKAKVEKRGGKWRITKFEPIGFFAPT